MTHSIVGRDLKTGEFGLAVASAIVSVGWMFRYAEAGVGVIAKQAWPNPYIGLDGLRLLKRGLTAQQVIDAVLAADDEADRRKRQIAILDNRGNKAVYTGPDATDWKGHRMGEDCIAAGNMLVDDGEPTINAMVEAFEAAPASEPLAEKLLRGLQAGQNAGGDRRGRMSSALLVVREHEYPYVDVRVDLHADPIPEMRRVYEAFKRYHASNRLFGPPLIQRIIVD
jgi:uncharacterized Ntn-hydrolase superfamily protein